MSKNPARAIATIALSAVLSLAAVSFTALPASADTGDDVPVGAAATHVTFSPDGSRAYVTTDTTQIVVMDTATHAVLDTITLPGRGGDLAMTADGATLYATDVADDSVYPIATSTLALGAPIAVGDQPYAILMSSDGAHIYVGNIGDSTVSVIDASTQAVVQTVTGTGSPTRLRESPDGAIIWAVSSNSPDAVMIDSVTYATQVFTPVAGGSGVADVTFLEAENQIAFVTLTSPDFALWVFDYPALTGGYEAFPVPFTLVLASEADPVGGGLWLPVYDHSLLARYPEITVVATGAGPADAVMRPDGGAVWVPTTTGQSVTIFTRPFPVSVPTTTIDDTPGATVTMDPAVALDSYDTLQWQSFDGTTWSDLAGETGTTLDVVVTTANQNARYRLVATSAVFGEVLSAEYAPAAEPALDPADTADGTADAAVDEAATLANTGAFSIVATAGASVILAVAGWWLLTAARRRRTLTV